MQKDIAFLKQQVGAGRGDIENVNALIDRMINSPLGSEIAGRSDAATMPAGTHVMSRIPNVALSAPRVKTRAAPAEQSDVAAGDFTVINQVAEYSGATRSQLWPIAQIERMQLVERRLLLTIQGRKIVRGSARDSTQMLLAQALVQWAQA